MKPIEVTEDLLVKIGFRYLTGGIELIKHFALLIDNIDIVISKYNSFYYCTIRKNNTLFGCFDFKYLHELQNGIRLITKADLEIKKL